MLIKKMTINTLQRNYIYDIQTIINDIKTLYIV
jgi:hypothetical protein